MISKTVIAAIAIAATVGVASPASAEFLETGTAINNSEGGLGTGGYDEPVPHGQQVLVNHWHQHERSQ